MVLSPLTNEEAETAGKLPRVTQQGQESAGMNILDSMDLLNRYCLVVGWAST